MWLRLCAVCLLVGLVVPASRAAEQENPFKTARVGDWIAYKMMTQAGGQNIEGTVKMTVKSKTDKEARLTTTAVVNGRETPPQETPIDLTKPYDPTQAGGLPRGTQATVKKVGDGKETLTVGTKRYDCSWTKTKVTAKFGEKNFESEIKVWTCKDVPLAGMVKMEMKSELVNMTMTLDEHGTAK